MRTARSPRVDRIPRAIRAKSTPHPSEYGSIETRAGAAQRRLLDHAELVALMAAERSGKVARRRERQEATLYTTLEPCALCMAAAMSFLLGRIVFAADAPVDGGTNLPDLWRPSNGHPPEGIPYAIPEVDGGVGREASIALIAEWTRRIPQRVWAAAYAPEGSRELT